MGEIKQLDYDVPISGYDVFYLRKLLPTLDYIYKFNAYPCDYEEKHKEIGNIIDSVRRIIKEFEKVEKLER